MVERMARCEIAARLPEHREITADLLLASRGHGKTDGDSERACRDQDGADAAWWPPGPG